MSDNMATSLTSIKKSFGIRTLLCVTFCMCVFSPSTSFAATIYANYTSGNDTTGDGTSGTPYKTFHKAYTLALGGDTINLTGTFNWSNADETGDASVSGYTLAKDLTIVGQGSTSTIMQSSSTEAVADRRIFTVSTGYAVSIEQIGFRHGRVSGSSNDGGAIKNSGTLSLDRVEMYRNRTVSDYGGAVSSRGALIRMTFPDGAAADAFVKDCKDGKHPEVIEQFKAEINLGAGAEV